MKIKENFKRLFPDMKKGIERFPVTTIFCLLLFVINFVAIEKSMGDIEFFNNLDKTIIDWVPYFIIAIPFSAFIELIREKYFENKSKLIFRIVNFLLICIFLIIFKQIFPRFFISEMVNLIATGIIFYMLFYLIPIIYRKENKEKYLQTVVESQINTILFSIILFLGLCAIFGAIDLLLINISNTFYTHSFNFSAVIFGVIFFISRLKGKDETLENYSVSKIDEILICYILIPLIFMYTTVLYLYFIKTLVLLKIPNGVVSHLVLWYTTFSVFVLIIATPIIKNNKLARFYKKYFPMISIPLIFLAFFSIFERISQYGITESRYLIVILCTWLLFNMIMFIIKNDVKLVLISYILAVLIAIFSPFNMKKISENSQSKRLERLLQKNGFVQNGKLIKNDKATDSTKRDISSVIDYFLYDRIFGEKKLKLLGKNYKNYEELSNLKKELNVQEQWEYSQKSNNGFVSYVSLKKEDITFRDIKNYDYYLEKISIDVQNDYSDSNINKNNFNIKIDKKNNILKVNKNDGNEILNVEMEKISYEVYNKFKNKIENRNENGVKLEENDLTYIGETEKGKYKMVFNNIYFSEKGKISDFNIDVYFSEK